MLAFSLTARKNLGLVDSCGCLADEAVEGAQMLAGATTVAPRMTTDPRGLYLIKGANHNGCLAHASRSGAGDAECSVVVPSIAVRKAPMACLL